jgi:vacuolar-type H+-ATPase subunit I/STV1
LLAVAVSGAAFAALCCFAPLLVAGLVSAIGLEFILKDSILMGLLVMFLGIAGLGLYLTRRKHV